MKVLWIARRELASMFSTAMGWLVLTAFLLVTGVFWFSGVAAFVEQSSQAAFDPYAGAYMQLSRMVGEFFGSCTIVVLMIAPALSMRLFAEEYKQHTIELLFTSPISTAEIVLGKYLGAMGFLAIMLLCTLHYPIALNAWADPQWPIFAVGYLALFLMGSALISIGMFFSSPTSNQIVASVLTLGVSLSLFLLSVFADVPDELAYRMALSSHLMDLLVGIVRVSDIVYFLGITGVCLFLTHQRLESFRWR